MHAQDESSAREVLAQVDPDLRSLSVDNDKMYATDCRVFTPEDAHSGMARVKEVLNLIAYFTWRLRLPY